MNIYSVSGMACDGKSSLIKTIKSINDDNNKESVIFLEHTNPFLNFRGDNYGYYCTVKIRSHGYWELKC